MHGNYPLDDHFEYLVRYNLATLSTLPLPLVALFTTAHDICMWKRCQNFVEGEGAGSSAYEKDVKTSSRGEGAGSSVCYTLPRPPHRDKVSSFSQTQIWSPYFDLFQYERHGLRYWALALS